MYIENSIVNQNDLLYIIEYLHSNILLFIITPCPINYINEKMYYSSIKSIKKKEFKSNSFLPINSIY